MMKTKHPLWGTYNGMLTRCYNSNSTNYSNYGGVGVYVCDSWLGPTGFAAFVEDMGPCPEGMSLDRYIDKCGPYCKENCKWSTSTEQNRNQRSNVVVTLNGDSRTVAEWSEDPQCVVGYPTLLYRIHHGWDIFRAMTTKVLGQRDKVPCSFRKCKEPHHCKGWCKGHYTQFKRKGVAGMTDLHSSQTAKTQRDATIVELAESGLLHKDIAAIIGLSRSHVSSLLRRAA